MKNLPCERERGARAALVAIAAARAPLTGGGPPDSVPPQPYRAPRTPLRFLLLPHSLLGAPTPKKNSSANGSGTGGSSIGWLPQSSANRPRADYRAVDRTVRTLSKKLPAPRPRPRFDSRAGAWRC